MGIVGRMDTIVGPTEGNNVPPYGVISSDRGTFRRLDARRRNRSGRPFNAY
jgi:hypothetical protein